VARLFFTIVLLAWSASSSQAQVQGILIDNFDESKKLQHWGFSNGPEFPGANGMLSVGSGYEGRGAVLAYRFTCSDQSHCGHYVAATWKPPAPIEINPGTALALWARFPPDVSLGVRVQDQTGQTLQYSVNTPSLEHPDSNEWLPIVVPITVPAVVHWGGANNGQLRGRIVSITILANSRYLLPTQGQMVLDNVRLIRQWDPILHVDRSSPVIMVPKERSELRQRLGVNIHFLNNDRALDIAKDTGFSFVRADLPWERLESHGEYKFAPFDALMQALEARRMGALWLLDYGHPEHGGATPQSADDIAAYARYAAAVVAHFRGHNARFEIWNEPNATKFLPNPSVYPDLLRAALDAIRREDSNAIVSTGGTSGFDFPFLTRMLKSGSAQKASAIAVHPYRSSTPETLSSDLLLLGNLIERSTGRIMPIWATEWGYASGDSSESHDNGHSDVARKRQAILAVRECLTVWALNLPVNVWYDLSDDGPNPFNKQDNFGLLNQDISEKPSMKALRTLTKTAQNYKYVGLVRDVPYGSHIMRLDGTDDVVFIAWSENETHLHIQFPQEQLGSVSNMFGEAMAISGNEVALDEKAGPIYIRLNKRIVKGF
jgi:polysaccharide biosynthesis protein PslG